MSSTDDGDEPRSVQQGRKAGRSVSGAPFPPGRSQRDGPERPTRQVPVAPDERSPTQKDAPPPTAAQEEDQDGT
jgi:hypothetical protein